MKLIVKDICGRWLTLCACTNTDISLALLVNYPVCPVTDGTDGTEPKMWPSTAEPGGALPGRDAFRPSLSGRVSLGQATRPLGLSGETGNPEIALFDSYTAYFTKTHETH